MLAKLLSTVLHTLTWAIPAYIIHPLAGLGLLVLGGVWFFVNPAQVTWVPRAGGALDRLRQAQRLLATLTYWAIGTAALSAIAWLARTAWERWG